MCKSALLFPIPVHIEEMARRWVSVFFLVIAVFIAIAFGHSLPSGKLADI